MGRRGPKPGWSTDDILDSAMELVAKLGLDALTVSSLARKLGTSPSAMYRYYDSKEALMVGLQVRAIAAYEAELREALDNELLRLAALAPDVAAISRILIVFGRYLDHAVEQPARHRLIDAFVSAPYAVLSDDLARVIDVQLGGVLEVCCGVLVAAEKQGVLTPGDPLQRTYVLWTALHGLDHFRKRDRIQPHQLRVPAIAEALFRSVLLGFGAPAATVDEAFSLLS